jgi:hypothetical protein
MKKLKELKNVHNVFIDTINELDNKLQYQLKKLKQEYQHNMIDEKIQLLMSICNGEGLDFEVMKTKYLKSKELIQIPSNDITIEHETIDDDLLDKKEINGKEYYYEKKDNGMVYDKELNQVGIFKDGQIILN